MPPSAPSPPPCLLTSALSPLPLRPQMKQNGRCPSEAAILGAQTVASLGMGLCLHGNLRPPAPGSHPEVWAAEMEVFQAWLQCLPFSFDSQRPGGDQAPHQLPSPNATGRNRWHPWVSFSFRLLPSISGSFSLSLRRHCISEYRKARACPGVLMPACVYVDTRVVPLSSSCLRRARPTPPSVPVSPWFLLYLLKKIKLKCVE